jgi:hypothetical protein
MPGQTTLLSIAAPEKIGVRVMIWITFRTAASKEEAAGNAAGEANAGSTASGSAIGQVSVRMMHHENFKHRFF